MSTVLHERPARLPLRQACVALGLNRSTVYARRRRTGGEPDTQSHSRKGSPQPRALSVEERQQVLETLHSEPYRDQPPAEAYQGLLRVREEMLTATQGASEVQAHP